MKELIVTVGVLLLLLTFPLQYALEQQNHYKESQIQKIVHSSKEKAKQKGYFTSTIKNDMINEISDKLKIERGKIKTTLTETVKYRMDEFDERGMIHYKVEVPFDKIIATPKFFGIAPEQNKRFYIIESETSSEYVKP